MPALRPGQSVVGDTAANWTAINPILQKNIIGIESDTHRCKIGNGTSAWSALTYTDEMLDYLTVNISGSTNGYVLTKGASSIICVAPSTIGVTDHGSLTGLTDDDHPQYLLVTATGTAAYTASGDYAVAAHAHHHGSLTGLTDDDHPQYLLVTATPDTSGFVMTNGSRDITAHIKGASTEPTNLQHLTNWSYVQRVGYHTPWRKSCVAASTCDINLASPPSTIDGISVANGDRILIWKQTDAKQNGIYEVSGL